MAKWIIDLPDAFNKKHKCKLCPAYVLNCRGYFGASERIKNRCPLANAKKAVEVKFEIDTHEELSIVDEKGGFHFDGRDKYYAVEDK